MTAQLLSIEQDIISGRLYYALLSMHKPIAELASNYQLRDSLQSIEQNYQYLLDYFIAGGDDPHRANILSDLSRSALALLDQIWQQYNQPNYALIQMLDKAKQYLSDGSQLGNFKKSFYSVLLQPEQEVDNCNIPAALLVLLLQNFSKQLFTRLIHLMQAEDKKIRVEAQTAFVLLMQRYGSRISFYQDLQTAINQLLADKKQRASLRYIFYSLLDTALTPLANKEMQSLHNDLLPQIDKSSRQVIITLDDADEDNPEWKDGIQSIINKHAGQMKKLHQQGADFNYEPVKAMLHDPFFSADMANYFIPFKSDNPELNIDFNSENGKLLKGLLLAHDDYCDVDRYAMCRLFSHAQGNLFDKNIPSVVRDLAQMGELDEKEEKQITEKRLITDFVRVLYRFFNHNPWGIENAMLSATQVGQSDMFEKIFTPKQQLKFADRCMALNCYKEAAMLYQSFPESAETLQKLGYAMQKQNMLQEAAVTYDNALALQEDVWTLSHLGTCLRGMNQKQKALRVYNRILEIEPQRKYAIQQKAQLLLDLNRQKEAMQAFFQLEALYPDDINSTRGMGWCALLVDDYQTAEKYLEQMAYDENATPNDLVNYGHLLLLTNHRTEALNAYLLARPMLEKNSQLLNLIRADRPLLLQKGLSLDLLTLIDEAILLQLKQKKL